MIKFDGRIVQFGFGAVGKSFYEKVSKEIRFKENNYFVVTMDKDEFDAYVNLGGMVSNFIVSEVTRENFRQVFEPLLSSGDLLIDFADMVGTRDICEWCAEREIMYINTGEADWPDHWYCILEENELKNELKKKYANCCKHPIVLQHGNNPGLVSHFVKAALAYVVKTECRKRKDLRELLKAGKFNEIAQALGVEMIHVNDIDLQKVKDAKSDKHLINTWCTDSFWFEMLSEATANIGTHEKIDYEEKCNFVNREKGFLEFKQLAADRKCRTYYPGGMFEGFLVPHEETITIAKSLEVQSKGQTIYRPTVMFLYSPCEYAANYLKNAKVNDYPEPDPAKPMDCENENGRTIIRGYEYPENVEILYQEKIATGTEYVGVLLLGSFFEPVWVGNRVETSFLYRNKKRSYWQTPTITPVAMSALAAVCWMLKNKDKGGIYFPDDIEDYKYIIKHAEKYISRTIYKTFSKEEVSKQLGIKFWNLQMKDTFVRSEVDKDLYEEAEEVKYEVRLNDDAMKKELFDYFSANLHHIENNNCSVDWDTGVYAIDGTLFMTQIASFNRQMYRTGDIEFDSGFDIECILFLKDGDEWIRESVSYLSRYSLEGKEITVYLSHGMEKYRERITEATRVYEEGEYTDTRTEKERKRAFELSLEYAKALKEKLNNL